MATIAEDSGLTTLVVVFTVEPPAQDELVSHLVSVAHQHSRHDGFISCSVHRSEDGMRVLEYIQWRSKAHLRAMLATPDGQEHLSGRGSEGEMHMYEVPAVIDANAG